MAESLKTGGDSIMDQLVMEKEPILGIINFYYKDTKIGFSSAHYKDSFSKGESGGIVKTSTLDFINLYMFGEFIGRFYDETSVISKANKCLNKFLQS